MQGLVATMARAGYTLALPLPLTTATLHFFTRQEGEEEEVRVPASLGDQQVRYHTNQTSDSQLRASR